MKTRRSRTPLEVVLSRAVVAREATYAGGSRIPRHAHAWGYLALVVRGAVDETCARATERRTAGAVRLMPSAEEHANAYPAEETRCLVVEIHEDAQDPLSPAALLHAPSTHDSASRVSVLARRMYAELRLNDDLSAHAADALLRELLVAAARESQSASPPGGALPRWLASVRDRLHDDFLSAPALAELAAEAGVHPSHLVRSFRRHFRSTPAEYVAHLRVERARHALIATAEPISRIALSSGFSDQAHFTRRFKAIVGTTPARYRRAFGD